MSALSLTVKKVCKERACTGVQYGHSNCFTALSMNQTQRTKLPVPLWRVLEAILKSVSVAIFLFDRAVQYGYKSVITHFPGQMNRTIHEDPY